MTRVPTFEEILATIAAASAGDADARVALSGALRSENPATKLAVAVNLMLDDLKGRSERLRQSEEKFAKAFRGSPAAISIASLPDGRWMEINEAHAKMTGYSSQELIGRTSAELGLVDAMARARILQAIREQGAVRNVEIQLRTKSGDMVDVLLSVEQIELNGQPCALTIQHDITELRRAEREVRRLNQDLQEGQIALKTSNKELEAFSYSVAHDLRAPLRSMDGFSQMLLDGYADRVDDKGKGYLRNIRESAQKMAQLIDDLLTLSHVTRSDLRRERVDLSALAREVIDGLRKADPGRKVEVGVSDGLSAEGDARLLRVILENLIGNAWKFTSRIASARIEFGSDVEGGVPFFFVRDNGAGFDPAFADKLFGVFQRLHQASEFPGTGIGLATVQRVVERHGGWIRGEGGIDKGATFRFTLEDGGKGL